MDIQLNQELIRICNNQSMYERGTHIQEMARDEFNSFDIMMNDIEKHIGKFNQQQLDLISKRKKAFKEFIETSYNEYLSIASKFVPIMVAGPANYNSKKYNKIAEQMDKKLETISIKINNFYDNTKKMLKEQIPVEDIIQKYRNGYNEPISSDDPKAKEKLQAKLEYLEEKHKSYLEFNKKARKEGKNQLPSYVLANSNQNIKSVKDRLKQLEKIDNLQIENYYFDNGEVHFDKEDNRVKIYFDEIPDSDVRQELKSHAYKWSPKNQCWQRKITPDAIYMTKKMFKDIGSLKIVEVKDYTHENELTM